MPMSWHDVSAVSRWLSMRLNIDSESEELFIEKRTLIYNMINGNVILRYAKVCFTTKFLLYFTMCVLFIYFPVIEGRSWEE